MASLQVRHQRTCAHGHPWTKLAILDDPGDETACNCRPMYHVVSRVDGRLVRDAVGRNRKVAERALTKVQHEIDEDVYEPPRPVTFDEWADTFLASLRRRETTSDTYASTFKYAREVFGQRRLRKLTAADVRAFMAHIEGVYRERHPKRKTISDATLSKHLRHLATCLEAARVEGLISENPVRRLPSSAKPKPRTKDASYFTDDELARLWPELSEREPYLYAAKLAATTGMRFGEIAGLRLADVQMLHDEIQLQRQWTAGKEVDTTKGGKPRTVDLVPGAVGVLEAWLERRGIEEGLLFEREVGGHLSNEEARGLLYGAMKRAGIPRVGEAGGTRDWHSFRHTFARIALESGALIQWVQGQLGHSSTKLTTDLYGRWSREAQKREAKRLDGAFAI